jgi:hypothetical protein
MQESKRKICLQLQMKVIARAPDPMLILSRYLRRLQLRIPKLICLYPLLRFRMSRNRRLIAIRLLRQTPWGLLCYCPLVARSCWPPLVLVHVFNMEYGNQNSTLMAQCDMGYLRLLVSLRITMKHCEMISGRKRWMMSSVHFKRIELGTWF